MTTIELQALLDRVKDEIRKFELPSADNSKKMFELLTVAVKNNGVLPLVSNHVCPNCKSDMLPASINLCCTDCHTILRNV